MVKENTPFVRRIQLAEGVGVPIWAFPTDPGAGLGATVAVGFGFGYGSYATASATSEVTGTALPLRKVGQS
ncbi:MAG: hypothetical protein HOU81_10000, partial [Hamadaea sp.]|nr:hypothetical protein [Hamadaea sp.]